MDAVVNPRLQTAGAILQFIRRGAVRQVVKLADGKAELLELQVTTRSKVVGKPLRELKFPSGAIIGAIVHNGNMIIPRGDSVIHTGDTVIVLTLPEAIKNIEKLFATRGKL
jgi:trk system potassium uptake protein TrkA